MPSRSSIGAGATCLPLLVLNRSFNRPVLRRMPMRIDLALNLSKAVGFLCGTQAHVILQSADLCGRHQARTQQAERVQSRTPLAVLHVGLAAWQIARLTGR